MAEKSKVRSWVVVAILVFPYSFLVGVIPLFEHCATKVSP